MKPILFRYPGIDSELDEEEMKKISKEADAEKLVLTEDTISKLKATLEKQKGSSDSRPHRGEWQTDDFTRESTGITLVFQSWVMKKPVRKDMRTPTYLRTPTIGPLYDGLYYGVGKRRGTLVV